MMERKPKSALLLLPNLLGETKYPELYLPTCVAKAVQSLDGLIAESPTAGKRYLDKFIKDRDTRTIPIAIIDKNTPTADMDFFLEPIIQGQRWGFVSDAGLPCIADPGSHLVFRARQRGIPVQAFVGPSSILLGLMHSGLPSQRFSFHGYLPKSPTERDLFIKKIEEQSKQENSTHLMMEPPHRNRLVLEELIKKLSPETWLCTAISLTLPDQTVICQKVSTWRKSILPQIDGKNALFIIYAGGDLN